jgi:uncharacterized protein
MVRTSPVAAVLASVLAAGALAACAEEPIGPAVIDGACAGDAGLPRVLVYSRENLWEHASTPVAQGVLLGMCASRGFTVTASSDPRVFAERLAEIDVVVFAVTSGEVLSADARAAFEPWLRGGGGMVGLHSASATELSWPFFVEAIGATFRTHAPGLFEATVTVEAPAHPIASTLSTAWVRTDEWYEFTDRPEERPGLDVLLALDEATLPAEYPAEFRVGHHPIAWTHERVGGRVFYTAMGHTAESYAEPAFVDMIARAILWTAPARGGS